MCSESATHGTEVQSPTRTRGQPWRLALRRARGLLSESAVVAGQRRGRPYPPAPVPCPASPRPVPSHPHIYPAPALTQPSPAVHTRRNRCSRGNRAALSRRRRRDQPWAALPSGRRRVPAGRQPAGTVAAWPLQAEHLAIRGAGPRRPARRRRSRRRRVHPAADGSEHEARRRAGERRGEAGLDAGRNAAGGLHLLRGVTRGCMGRQFIHISRFQLELS